MPQLISGILAGSVFAILISRGQGKRLTQHATGRVLLGATGFLIAIATFAWWKYDFWLFVQLCGWFIACCAPVLVGGVIDAVREEDRLVNTYETKLTDQEIGFYSVKESHDRA